MRSWPHPVIPQLPAALVEHAQTHKLALFDTADQQVGEVTVGSTRTPEQRDGIARMYVCGITPYDSTHLGHAATYLTFDLINRQLRAAGTEVHYVQNITDVDDPLFERAARDGIDWQELGTGQIDLFRSDMEALSVIPPQDYVGAVEAMDEVATAVGELLDAGVAYPVNAEDAGEGQDIYFPITATAEFGYESNYDRDTMARYFAERGGDPDREGKRDPLDALLWRAHREWEPSWDSPMGPGRAGWHIECSVIATNRFGGAFDIQGGGSDLIFPHHEFSAAHMEAATGCARMAGHYVHVGMIGLDGEKMSKSRGNLVFVSKLTASGVDPAAIRLALMDGHYQADRMWTNELLTAAEERLTLWRRALAEGADVDVQPALLQVIERLADNLDTEAALQVIDHWALGSLDGVGEPQPGAKLLLRDSLDALMGVKL